MKADDAELVRRCLAGDADAFAALLERYEKPVFNLALRMVGNRGEASDVVQTVFLRAYRGLDGFDPRQRFFSWLYRIAVNESLDAIGRLPPTQRLEGDFLANDPDPEQSARAAEACVAVRGAVMQLSPDHRAVIVLRHHVDCSYSEIGRILEVAENTVKSRLFEARQQLKARLIARGVEGV